MEKKLFKQMNWPEIETICYSEHQRPHEILGPHSLGNHTLIQCFIPGQQHR
jgi:1,4-alpha-glucan branching enzyme